MEISNTFLERFRILPSTLIYLEKWDHAASMIQSANRIASTKPDKDTPDELPDVAQTESHAKARLASGSVGGLLQMEELIYGGKP